MPSASYIAHVSAEEPQSISDSEGHAARGKETAAETTALLRNVCRIAVDPVCIGFIITSIIDMILLLLLAFTNAICENTVGGFYAVEPMFLYKSV